jgi:hypothetical protein
VRIIKKLLFVTVPALLVVVAVVAGAVEVWVRASWDARKGVPGFFVSDPVRGQRLAANYSGWFAGVPVHINSLELRDTREYALEKGPRTFRILVLGDSVTFGHGSVYEYTYPYLLEQQLKAWRPDVDWQVWNAAVPGYNTSQELAQLVEVGPRFKPDLVVVGFYENDLIDNSEPRQPGAITRAVYRGLSFARRHIYSLELYKRVVLTIAWRLSSSDEYRLRLDHVGTEEALLTRASDARALEQQRLSPYDWLSDDEVAAYRCPEGMKPDHAVVDAVQRQTGFRDWLEAVRGFQALQASGAYRIVFFLNVVPRECYDRFYDATRVMNDFYLQVMGNGTPAVSCHEAFLHTRPSQMPFAAGHSLGNANALKANVLFDFLRTRVLPSTASPRPPDSTR